MKRVLSIVLFCSGTLFADYVPAQCPVILRSRLGRMNVTMRVGDEIVCPANFSVRRSLAGEWKFKGLDRQGTPFGSVLDSERMILSPETDDKDWVTIEVPVNWWADDRFSYEKMYDPQEVYFRGYYRRNLPVQNPSDGKRRFLRFEEIGAEAEIYVNGSFAGRHIGDFVPCEIEITRFLKPGDNLIGVRVLADLGPQKKDGVQIFTRPYGAHWGHTAIKGGIWHDVSLETVESVRIGEMRIDPSEDFTSVRVRGTIDNVGQCGEFELVAALVEDVPDAPTGKTLLRTRLCLNNGVNEFDVVVPAEKARAWTPDDPNLYWAALALTDATGRTVAAKLERFGFRTMRIDGNRFLLNGRPVYLTGDSIHSLSYGGWPGKSGKQAIECRVMAHKRTGVNMIRTAHMPAIPELYDFADEIGMMIYDEWANSFCNRIDEKEFERNNLPALEAFIRRDYNHASVVLWSLGNEVEHHAPEVARQLDKQYDLVKRLDGQNRPACAFSSVAYVRRYGSGRLKTDFLDHHDYCGIDGTCWTRWFQNMNQYYTEMLAAYGENGELKMPLVMWESVGAGWGVKTDEGMVSGDVTRYVDWLKRPCGWGDSEGIPFSAAAGLMPILDPVRGKHYLQGYLSARLCEFFRQDRRFAGFAVWFSDPYVPGITRWTQPVYPLLRNDSSDDGHLMFRQLFSPDARKMECVVENSTDAPLKGARVSVSLFIKGREYDLGECVFDQVSVFEEGVRPFCLEVPDGLAGDGEVRLRLTRQDGEDSFNSYQVRIHSKTEILAPATNARPVALAGADSRLSQILERLDISHQTISVGKTWAVGESVVVPPGMKYNGSEAHEFVQNGGTLLLLEPTGAFLAGFPPLFLAPCTNHLVEPVVPAHPAFDGLTADDLDTWAENPCGITVPQTVCPLDEGVLACRPRYINGIVQYGMGLCEYAIGKGRLIVSTIDAVRLWDRNPAATRYVRNLLAYVSCGQLVKNAPVLDDIVSRPKPKDVNPNPLMLLSMRDRPFKLSFNEGVTDRQKAPFNILFFKDKLQQLAHGKFRYFTFTFRSDTADGMFDVTIPKDNHRNRLTCTIPTEISRGRSVTLRLDLEKDFRFAQEGTFGLDNARGEIIFYNGYERESVPSFPRPPLEVEITEMRFE